MSYLSRGIASNVFFAIMRWSVWYGFIAVDIDGIREPVSGSLIYGNNIISGAVVPTSNAIGLQR